ncbi:hypothetical protein [Xanthomonas phage Xp15]|uniref:Uncharacterized protein n=1 Tax=Xanthomonas phage Xp15 TaxID=322855 RepID=Q52PS8_9CAUD|nr:hypothetical protein XPXV15_gp83 [Xanthomonas phage Xp15]AAX84925.1 hypothetical protein [Xanthomonas phage Xp15]
MPWAPPSARSTTSARTATSPTSPPTSSRPKPRRPTASSG